MRLSPMAGELGKQGHKAQQNLKIFRPVSMTNVRLNALKTPTAPMATIATTAAGKGKRPKILAHISKGALRIRAAQKTSSVLVLMPFVTSLPMKTASTVTAQQTAQRVRKGMSSIEIGA